MFKFSSRFKSILSIIAFVSMSVATIYGAGLEPLHREVVKRDARGRVQVMEARAAGGTCMAEITYQYKRPQIHIIALSHTGVQNIGALVLQDESEDSLSDSVLMEDFNLAMEFCLPIIIKGYTRV